MSEMNPGGRDQSLLPPPPQGEPAPPAWAPPPPAPTPNDTLWNRVAAFVVLIAIVGAAAGAGIGFTLARAVNSHQAGQAAQTESPITQVTPGTGASDGGTSATAAAARVVPAIV